MIVERAQGIPLYAVESIRALIDRDVVRPIEGVYRLVGDIGELEVPDSLHALLAARLDALDPQVRQVLTDAAVLGSELPGRGRCRRVRAAPDDVDSILVRAAAPRGLAGVGRSAVAGAGQLPLLPGDAAAGRLRDVVAPRPQGSAPRRRRPPAGDVSHDGEEVIDVVARHYVDALEAVPDDSDVGEIRELAIAALIRAAERRPGPARRREPAPASSMPPTSSSRPTSMILELPTCCCAVPRRCDSARPPWSPCRSPSAPSRPTSGSATIGPWPGHASCSGAPASPRPAHGRPSALDGGSRGVE